MFLDLVDWRFTHDAMYRLRPEMRGRRAAEHHRNVRILDRVLDVVPSGDADLQCRRRRIRLEGRDASIPGQELDRVAQLKAHHGGGRRVCRAASHVPQNFGVLQPDVMGVRIH